MQALFQAVHLGEPSTRLGNGLYPFEETGEYLGHWSAKGSCGLVVIASTAQLGGSEFDRQCCQVSTCFLTGTTSFPPAWYSTLLG